MRWLKRDFLIKFSLVFVITATILVGMNIFELMNSYISSSSGMDNKTKYKYEELKELRYKTQITDDASDEEYQQAILDIQLLFDSMPEFEGNIILPAIPFEFLSGCMLSCNILLAQNEELPYLIDKKGCSDRGIFVGNTYDGYWSDGKIELGYGKFEVSGIISNDNLELNEEIYIPYDIISDQEKEYVYNKLYSGIMWDNTILIVFASDKAGVVERDMEHLDEKLLSNNVNFELKNMSSSNMDYISFENKGSYSLYKVVKKVICIIAVLFCIFAVFETLRLFISKKKSDITILWSLGTKKSQIVKMLINELGMAIIIGAAVAFIAEWIVYKLIMNCRFIVLVKYGMLSLATVILLAIIMLTVMLVCLLRKPVISVIKSKVSNIAGFFFLDFLFRMYIIKL